MMKPAYIRQAEKLLGEKEIKGPKHNQRIRELYMDAVGEYHPDEVAWCAAFVGATLTRAGYENSGSLAARSYERGPGTVLDGPEKYAIGVMRWTNSSWKGHVGYVVRYDDDYVWMLGGNQSDQVKVSRYSRHGGRLRFIAYIRPEKRYVDLRKVSRKYAATDRAQKATLVSGVGLSSAFMLMSSVREFMYDNVGLILLGVAAVVLGGLYVYKRWIQEDYEDDRYTPSGERERDLDWEA